MHSIEIDLIRTIIHASAPKLKGPARYLHHIRQFFWRQDDNVLYAPKQEERTEQMLLSHYVMQPFAFKKKKTGFYNITHKPAITYILKTLIKHDFLDVKILTI